MPRRHTLAILFAFVTAVLIAGFIVGRAREQRVLGGQLERLSRIPDRGLAMPTAGVNELPGPVERYLRRALSSVTHVRAVSLKQIGTLRTDVHSERWLPFNAEHHVFPGGTGFVWNARVGIAPMLHVRVRDAYIEGQGSGQVTVMSALPVSSAVGTPEMNAGSLHRFLAEAAWYPTVLLPSATLQWKSIDARRALATLTDHGTTVSLEFRFADTGEISSIYTPARWGTFDGHYEQRPWEGHFRHYVERGGMWVPSEGDVGWYVDGTWRAVWVGRVIEFRAELR